MILADKITEERKKNGWSQEELANQLGVSRQAVSKWESAGAVPDLQRILQMSELFGVSTDYLLKDEMKAENITYHESTESYALLFDSERVVQKSWNEVGRQMGFGERFGDHIYHTIGFNVVRREQYFKEHVSPDFPMEEFTENTRRIYHRIMEEDGVDRKPGAEELLKYAKEHGYRLALATSSRELHAQLLLKKYGLFDYFDGAVYGNMVSAGKPDPEIYLKACASIQVLPEFAIALEDAPSGIRSAAAAGMRPVMIPDLVEPDEAVLELVWRRFDTLYDVIDLLESDFQNS